MSDHYVQNGASGLKVRAMPWQSNAPRDGTWHVSIRPQCRHAWESECCGGAYTIAAKPDNRFSGASKEAAVLALRAFIVEAKSALQCLLADEEYGAVEDPE